MADTAAPGRLRGAASPGGDGGSGPLFGRGEVHDEVVRHLRLAADGAGRTVLLTGGVGLGKTTMLRAAITSAQELGFQVLSTRALPSDVPEPFALVQGLLRSARLQSLEKPSSESPEVVLPLFLAPVERRGALIEGFEEQHAEESREAEEASRLLSYLSSPRERLTATRTTLFAQLTEFFRQLAGSGPLLLALDDLQFADDSSLEFLELFVPTLDRSRLAVVATTAPLSELSGSSRAALEQLFTSAHVETLRIRPMTESELADYVKWMMHGRDPGHDAIMRWFSQTEGNPLFAEHLVRRHLSTGGSAESTRRPTQDFDEVLNERIRGLGEPDRRVLVYAAVLGKEFDFATLAVALGGDEERLSESVDRLVHIGILREKGGELYEFVSERARADVYGPLTETRRRILHRNAARAIEARGGTSTSTVFELARQFYLGRDDPKAVEYNRRAGDLAADAFALETAIVFLERALECARRLTPRDTALELRLLIELGRFLAEMGDLKRSEELLLDAEHRARAEPGRESDLALALLGLARTRTDMSQYAEARALATEASGILEQLGNRRGVLAAHRVLGITSWRLGDLEQAELHQRQELAIADVDGTPTERGHARIDLANTLIAQSSGRAEETLRLYDEAEHIFADHEDYASRARVLMNRSLFYHNAGRMPEALADLTKALDAAERSHSRIWISYCLLNLAQFRAELHEPEEANRLLERGEKLLEAQGDELFRQQATMIRGIIAEEVGESDRAETLFHEALRLALDLGLGAEIAEMHFRLAGLALRRGDREAARQSLTLARNAGIATIHADLLNDVDELARKLGEGPSAPTA